MSSQTLAGSPIPSSTAPIDPTAGNENTTQVAETIVKGGGEGTTSFDELEAFHDQAAASGKKAKTADSKEKPGSKETAPGDKKDPGDVPPEAAGEKKVDAGKNPVKLYKVKHGDSELDLRSDTQFEVKVNGKTERIPLQDLLNEFSGKTDYGRKYQELDKVRKSFESERKGLQDAVNQLYQRAVVDKDPRGAIEYLAEAMGADGEKVFQELQTQLNTEMEQLSAASPEEREKLKIQNERDYLRRKLDADKATKLRTQEVEHVASRVKSVQDKHKIENGRFYQLYEELKASGQIEAAQITPELVGDYYLEVSSRSEIRGVLKEINPQLPNLEKVVSELREVMVSEPSMTMADIKDIAAEVYGSKALKNLSQKIRKSQPVNTARTETARKGNEPVFFDDLDT